MPLCFVKSSEGRKESVHHLSNESWLLLEGVVSPFFSGQLVERSTEFVLVLASLCQ